MVVERHFFGLVGCWDGGGRGVGGFVGFGFGGRVVMVTGS